MNARRAIRCRSTARSPLLKRCARNAVRRWSSSRRRAGHGSSVRTSAVLRRRRRRRVRHQARAKQAPRNPRRRNRARRRPRKQLPRSREQQKEQRLEQVTIVPVRPRSIRAPEVKCNHLGRSVFAGGLATFDVLFTFSGGSMDAGMNNDINIGIRAEMRMRP